MAHVIADHVAIRADQARHARWCHERRHRRAQRSDHGRTRVGAVEIRAGELFRAHRNWRPMPSASASPPRPGSIPHGASRFLTAMGRNAELKTGPNGPIPFGRFHVVAPATMDRIQDAQLNRAPACHAQRRRTRPRRLSRQPERCDLWRRSRGRLCAWTPGSCIRVSGSHSRRPTDSLWRTPRKPCLA